MREIKTGKPLHDKLSKTIDGIIGIFSPKAAFARKRYRLASYMTDKFSSHYRGAAKDRVKSSWVPGDYSADEVILNDLPDLRERSRDLVRNDPYAGGAINTIVTNDIGTGIKMQSRVDGKAVGLTPKQVREVRKVIEAEFNAWAQKSDAGDRLNFSEIQAMIDRNTLVNGEALVMRILIDRKHKPYSLCYQMIESDRMDTPSGEHANKYIRKGVKIGKTYGEPISYYIRKAHPGTYIFGDTTKKNDFLEIPKYDKYGHINMFHLYWVERPGQSRGVPILAPVIDAFRNLGLYMEAELMTARIGACISMIIETPEIEESMVDGTDDTNSSGDKITKMKPAGIVRLHPGEKMQQFKPERPGMTFDPFVDRVLQSVCASLNLPYELVLKDFRKSNYSSARSALLEARRYFRMRQQWLVNKFCQPAYRQWMEEAVMRGRIPHLSMKQFIDKLYLWTAAKWIAPGWEWVDPVKDATATKIGLENKIMTHADVYASRGEDWEEGFEQIAVEQERKKELGIDSGQPREENNAGSKNNNDVIDDLGNDKTGDEEEEEEL